MNLRTPEERTCERCGRGERWDPGDDTWRIRTEDGEALVGDRFCLHEWDIDGSFEPVDH